MNRYTKKMCELDARFKEPDLEADYRRPLYTASESELAEVEHDLGFALPPDYREFLRDYGGCVFYTNPEFHLRDSVDGEQGSVVRFFGVTPYAVNGVNHRELVRRYRNTVDTTWPLDLYPGLLLVRPFEQLERVTHIIYVGQLLAMQAGASDEEIAADDDGAEGITVKWPKELLPIGVDGGNNETYLALAGENKGRVYFKINMPMPDYQNFYLVADSFDEFMNSLYLPD